LTDLERIFKEVFETAQKDPNIIGLVLGGSRGKGFATKYSDYDTYMVVKDDAFESYEKKFSGNAWVFSLTNFKSHAAMESQHEGDRYNFTHLQALIDKNGEIQSIVDEKGRIPKDKIQEYVSSKLDAYINYIYRSLKCFRDGNIVGTRLEASKSIHYFLNVIFGLEGRITPYYKYLEWELEKFPLKKFPMKNKDIINSLLTILETANINHQQKLFKVTEKVCREEGYTHVFDNWINGEVNWILSYKHESK
jgi:hypothetical protein